MSDKKIYQINKVKKATLLNNFERHFGCPFVENEENIVKFSNWWNNLSKEEKSKEIGMKHSEWNYAHPEIVSNGKSKGSKRTPEQLNNISTAHKGISNTRTATIKIHQINKFTVSDILNEANVSRSTLSLYIKDNDIKPDGSIGGLSYYSLESKSSIIDGVAGSTTATSIPEKELVDWIRSIYSGIVLENDRTVLDGKELDIYIPEKHLAIEYDGCYWHCELNKDKNYHYNKTIECEKKGVRLIHYFSTDSEPVIKSIIASGLGVYSQKYMARKLSFNEISTKDASAFLDATHLHGSAKCNRAFGLFDGNELVQVVTFGFNRFSRTNKGIELIRMATKLNCQVVGGFSRLIKDSMKEMNIDTIESFVDRRVYNGSGYNSSGWKVVGESAPAYHYWDAVNNVLYNRQKFMKQSCLKRWADCDESMTEHEMCLAHKLYRIYDCGNIKLTYSI